MTTSTEPGAATAGAVLGDLPRLLELCTWPSEAFWRLFELAIVKRPGLLESPILEIGCGDGGFTELAGLHIDMAIDRNPRAVERARSRGDTYASVRHVDLHDFVRDAPPRYRTVFANSVLEHVADLERVLPLCCDVLQPGGRLVTTVPLVDMNDHLSTSRRWYARMRARQLEHRNLWSVREWEERLRAAGFGHFMAERYLDPVSCRFWDRIDLLGNWGFGRYRLAVAIRLLSDSLLPIGARNAIKRRVLCTLAERYRDAPAGGGSGCAALLIATKGAGGPAT
jgi:SAM-dependent methyltransferase